MGVLHLASYARILFHWISDPTIERVRQHIGRGSPNTVSPHLDTWFARLGTRIADPQAFRADAAQHASLTERLLALGRHAQAQAQAQADADMDRERQARLLAEQLARADADQRALSQAQFVSHVQALAKAELRAQALQDRLDRVEAERLRVRIRERRAEGVGGGGGLAFGLAGAAGRALRRLAGAPVGNVRVCHAMWLGGHRACARLSRRGQPI